MEHYFVQYICAAKENGFKAHYAIYQKSPLQLANKTKYKRIGNANRAMAKLEKQFVPTLTPSGGAVAKGEERERRAMKDEHEIRKAWERAVEKAQTNSGYHGVADALAWVLEESDDDPSE